MNLTEPRRIKSNAPARLPVLASLLIAALLFTQAVLAQDAEDDPYLRARQASVFLMQTYEDDGTQVLSCVGSGTLISASGMILTNAHLTQSTGPCQGDRIIVALPVRLNEPPVPTYLAEAVQVDTQLDLAVLQISGGLDGSQIDPEALNLPYASLGDSSGLLPGNGLTFIGYHDIGATSVSATQGVITGITAEKNASRMAWFRTDAEIGGGMSGGGAYNNLGQLVGIPTSAPATTGEQPGPMCLSIQDNTHDGLINDRDACVPIGGPVTAIRPILYARPLIDLATNNFRLEYTEGLPETPLTEGPRISRIYFSPQIGDNGLPTQVVSAMPSGITSLFMFFEYDNMVEGMPYEIRVAQNGVYMPQFSLGPLSWGGGQQGIWHFGTEGKTWPDGSYEFTVLVTDQVLASTTLQIGGAFDEQVFSNLDFAAPNSSGTAIPSGTLLPAGITQIDASFNFSGMTEGQPWTEVWYLNDAEVYRATYLWERGPDGQMSVSAINLEGLPAGRYKLDLLIGDRLAATGGITLAGNDGSGSGASVFYNNVLASDITREGEPSEFIGSSGIIMPVGINQIYAFVDWDFMPTGTQWTYRWFLDGRLVGSSTQLWDSGAVGTGFWVSLKSDDPLPEGAYAVEVLVESKPMFSSNLSIGSGTQPVSGTETETDEVLISGRVIDALTGEGISGALIIVLDVRFESPDFTWDESQILTQAISDREGSFSLPRGLTRRNYFTMYVFADDYITIVEDNYTIPRDYPSPADVLIEMSRP